MNLIDKVRSKSREEYQELAQRKYENFRDWIQRHGELAMLFGVLFGMFFVLAFKLVILLIVLCVLAAIIVWQISLPENEKLNLSETDGSLSMNGHGKIENGPDVVDEETAQN